MATMTTMRPTHAHDLSDRTTVRVTTEASKYRPGITLNISTFDHPPDMLNGGSQVFQNLIISLTADDADEIAALLVAHAFDRRQQHPTD